jgi:hypothetical protein
MKLTVISIVQVLLLLVFLDPGKMFSLSTINFIALTFVIAALGVYAIFIGREHVGDERDAVHRMLAGRVAFHVGAGLLTIGIAVQAVNGNLDQWLVVVLVSMIVAKTIARMYADRKR